MGTVCFQTTGLLPECFSAANVTAACFYCSRMKGPPLRAWHKCQDTFILKLNAQLIFNSCVWESWFERCTKWWENGHLHEQGLFHIRLFYLTKWWPMQREEMTSQLDLHFSPLFERRVSVLCQFLHSFRPQAQRARWIRNRVSSWPQQLFKWGGRQIHV